VNQLATREPRNNVEAVCMTISKPEFKQRLASALPPGVNADRFQRVVLTAIQQNPKLADYDRQQLYNQCLRAAADGLVPDGREGAFVDMGGKLTWMPMVAGIIKRLATAGITIDAQLVHENDEFEQLLGDDAAIHHKAPKLGQPRGDIIGVYAIARLPNGMVMREVMDREAVEQVRNASRAKNSGPWVQWWGEMARKTVIRRLAKRLPILDPSVNETIQRDDDLYDFAAGNAQEGDTTPTATEATANTGPRRPRGLEAVAAAAGRAPEPDNNDEVIDGEIVDRDTGEIIDIDRTSGSDIDPGF
jgi:recombination protein RecT